jgi:hypothetical protein
MIFPFLHFAVGIRQDQTWILIREIAQFASGVPKKKTIQAGTLGVGDR